MNVLNVRCPVCKAVYNVNKVQSCKSNYKGDQPIKAYYYLRCLTEFEKSGKILIPME